MSFGVTTIAIVQSGDQVLLGKKKKGLGAGYWNGFGGKVEAGETVAAAAARELTEESGLVAHMLDLVGIVRVSYLDQKELAAGLGRKNVSKDVEMSVFRTTDFTGTLRETNEMQPQWFAIEDVPYDLMWPDDKYWLPLVLAGKQFAMECVLADQKTLVSHSLTRSGDCGNLAVWARRDLRVSSRHYF